MFGKLIWVAALANVVLAQGINITVPAAGSTVAAGSAITVEVERPVRATSWGIYPLPTSTRNVKVVLTH